MVMLDKSHLCNACKHIVMRTLPLSELSGAAQVGQVAASLKAGGDLFHARLQTQALSTIQHTCMSMLTLSHCHATVSLAQCCCPCLTTLSCHSAIVIALVCTAHCYLHSVVVTLLLSLSRCCFQCRRHAVKVLLSLCDIFKFSRGVPLLSGCTSQCRCHNIIIMQWQLLSGITWQAQDSIRVTRLARMEVANAHLC